MEKLKTILSIAGSDCSGGAGIQADIRGANALGVHCMTAVTAVTVQNSNGIHGIIPIPKGGILDQVKAVTDEVMPDAIKIGLIIPENNGDEIFEIISIFNNNIPIVVDPVISVSSGGLRNNEIEISSAIKFYRELFRNFNVIPTPNIKEAELILGKKLKSVSEYATELAYAFDLYAAVVTGGDVDANFKETSVTEENSIVDALAFHTVKDGKETIDVVTICSPKTESINLHGTGCLFSTLLASNLSLGKSITQSFTDTSRKMHEIIEHSGGYKLGNSSYGPLNISNYLL